MDLIKKRILIIGSNGKLGLGLARRLSVNGRYEILCSGIEEKQTGPGVDYLQADITRKNSIKSLFHNFFPDVVINAAGYTNVDLCETNKELSWNINVKGTENIAISSWAIDAHMIHISTDYIFDGKEGPYTEEDVPNPISYYGRTKLASENSLRTSGTRYTILRTNVLYGSNPEDGHADFARWAAESLKKGKQISVVTDQMNNPTYIPDLVNAVINIIEMEKQGIYNIGGAELLSRYDFAVRIAEHYGLNKELIIPVTTESLKQPAPRPLKSGLIIRKAERELGFTPTPINETLDHISV